MAIADLVTGIETRTAAVLGVDYSALGYVEDVTRNNFKGASKRYGVIAGDLNQVETSAGVLGSFTVIQDFVVKLTDRFAPSQAGDSGKLSVQEALIEQCLLVYKDLIQNRAGSPAVVLNVLDGMNTATEFHEEDNIVEVAMSVQLLYRRSLI